MKSRRCSYIVLVASLVLAVSGLTHGQSQTLLFLDDEEVFYRSGTQKQVVLFEKPLPHPVIAPDQPWEGMIGWTSCYRDEATGKYQMWYQAYQPKRTDDKRLRCVVCYAESKDGIQWTKPKLDLFPYYEIKKTNIVLIGAGDEAGGYGDRYCNSVVVDSHTLDPSRRYKMLYYDWRVHDEARLGAGTHAAFSPDGVHWEKYTEAMVSKTSYGGKGIQPPFADENPYVEIHGKNGQVKKSWHIPISMSDAMDVFFDPLSKHYVSYGKMWIHGPDGSMAWKHGMGRIESDDFIRWSKPTLVLTINDADPAQAEFHTSPVFVYNGQYLSVNQILDRRAGTIDVELMSSRDGWRWDRSFANKWVIPRGSEGTFDSGSILSNGTPIILEKELRFYYGAYRGSAVGGGGLNRQVEGSNDYFSGVGMAITPRDRFVSVEPNPLSPIVGKANGQSGSINTIGQVTLRKRELSRVRSLHINADASHGSVRVEILNEDGFRMRGFSKDDAIPLVEDGLDMVAKWKDKSLADLPAGNYLIRVHLDRSKLFAVRLH